MRLADFSSSTVLAGFITVLVGFTSSAVIVFQAAAALGATPVAEASREVSTKIQNVSREADSVGNSATEVRAAIASVTKNVEGLRQILVRVVRTSTQDANRRKFPRFAIQAGVDAHDASGARVEGTLVDASEGGAHVRTTHAIRNGERGTLRFDGLAQALAFAVRERVGDQIHLEFDKPPADYAPWLARRSAGLKSL